MVCAKMQESDAHEQQTGGYEQCLPEKTRQIRPQATDKSKQKELNDNPYHMRTSLLRGKGSITLNNKQI